MPRRRVLDLRAELRADEEAARGEVEVAEAACAAAAATVPPEFADAEPDHMRGLAAAVEVTRSAAVIEYRTLGKRPEFDATAESAAIDALRALEEAAAATATVRRQSHLVLGVGNLLGIGAIGNAAFRFVVWAADPVSTPIAMTVLAGGSFPVAAMALSATRVLWSARRVRKLKPDLAAALRTGGCRSVRELADRREDFDHWHRRARRAAEAGDRCALAVREWYQVAGVGADPREVDDLIAGAEWYRVTRAAVERARVAHRIAAARLARAEVLAVGGEPPAGEEPEPASDRIQIALLRLRRGARLAWRHAS